jgi:hypothetical protein
MSTLSSPRVNSDFLACLPLALHRLRRSTRADRARRRELFLDGDLDQVQVVDRSATSSVSRARVSGSLTPGGSATLARRGRRDFPSGHHRRRDGLAVRPFPVPLFVISRNRS